MAGNTAKAQKIIQEAWEKLKQESSPNKRENLFKKILKHSTGEMTDRAVYNASDIPKVKSLALSQLCDRTRKK